MYEIRYPENSSLYMALFRKKIFGYGLPPKNAGTYPLSFEMNMNNDIWKN